MSEETNDTAATAPLDGRADGLGRGAAATDAGAPVPEYARPRIRYAAIVWGAFFAAFGVWIVMLGASAERRRATVDWIASLSGPGWVVVGVVVLGAFILACGLIAVLRAATRPR